MRFAALAFLVCLPSTALAGGLDAQQIRDELVGQLIAWWDDDGWVSGHMILLPDGRADLELQTPNASRDDGQWAIEGDTICTTWSSLRGGQAKCYTVERAENGRFLTSGGNLFEIRSAGA